MQFGSYCSTNRGLDFHQDYDQLSGLIEGNYRYTRAKCFSFQYCLATLHCEVDLKGKSEVK